MNEDAKLWIHTAGLWKKLAEPGFREDLDLHNYSLELGGLLMVVHREAEPEDCEQVSIAALSEAIEAAQTQLTNVEYVLSTEQYGIAGIA